MSEPLTAESVYQVIAAVEADYPATVSVQELACGVLDWYAEGLKFSCTRCGNCCRGDGFVQVTAPEIDRLARYMEMDPVTFGETYLDTMEGDGPNGHISLTALSLKDDRCVFYHDEVGCLVYEARPDQCRTWPFWPDVLSSRDKWDKVAEGCPGMNRGKLIPAETIRLRSRETPPGLGV